MNLLIIGHSVLDIITADAETKKQPGGIFYTIAGLNTVKSDNDNIDLLTKMDFNSYKYFSEQFSKVSLINNLTDDKIPSVILETPGGTERMEKYENFAGKMSLSNIKNPEKYDAVLINMITGNDINVNDLVNFREKYKGIIYFDVHTLARGTDEKGNRIFRKIPDADKWLCCLDIIQANESEILTLTPENDELYAAKYILSKRVSRLIVTKGENGLSCYSKDKNGILKIDLSAKKVHSINSIGCGDIFGAVFFYSYIYGLNLMESLQKAITAASVVTTFDDIKQLNNLKECFQQAIY